MAGLLDYLYDPSTYGGNGGLLSRLAPSLGMLPQSQGFPQDQQAQASPMQIGDYQMPRMGAPDQYQPQQAMTPPNAQPAQGQMPQGMPAPAQPAPLPPALENSGGLGAGFRGLAANLHNGPIGALIGGIGGAMGMQDQRQQNLRAQYDATRQALIANGVPERQASSTAMLSVMNPEAAKTVLPELLTNKEKYQVISEDPLQGKQYGFVNDREQTINGKPIGQGTSSGQSQGLQATIDQISSSASQGATREQLLQHIPSAYRGDVEALVSGRGVPANMGRAQVRGTLLTLAHAVDPNFDETQIPARVQARKSFAPGGKDAASIGSFNTVQHHLGTLSDNLETLAKAGGGTDWPILNQAKSIIANNTSFNPKLRDAAQGVNDAITAVDDEMANAYKAGRVSDKEIERWHALMNSNLPIDQQRKGISDFVELLNGKRDQLNAMHKTMFGDDAPLIEKGTNEEITTRVHNRYKNGGDVATNQSAAPAGGVQEGATATNPQTGQKITFRGGKWQ